MKSFTRRFALLPLVGVTTMLLSWNKAGTVSDSFCPFLRDNFFSAENDIFQKTEEASLSAFLTEEDEDDFFDSGNIAPSAEDVLIKKIPGDNNHLLMMAYYSKENYPVQPVSIDNGGVKYIFRDDGQGDDKVAGDGYFTSKIFASVNEFRQIAVQMNDEFKRSGGKRIRFVNRAMVVDPDAEESFDVQSFDNSEAVSLTSLSGGGSHNKLLDSLQKNSEFITAVGVMEDPSRTWNPCKQTGTLNGAWSFKTIMKNLASTDSKNLADDATISDFVKSWLHHWEKDQTLNKDKVGARKLVDDKILDPWLNKSEKNGSPKGQLDMKFAPFKLTAIVNRFDLRERFSGIPGGEVRFVFCLIDTTCTKAENFTFIAEYSPNIGGSCDDVRSWATQWFNLKNFTLGSSAYNSALQKITDQVTKCGDNPNRTNQSCLNHIRTNDRALSNSPVQCEFREFVLSGTSHQLKEVPCTDAPADRYNAQVDNQAVERMVRWVNQNRKAIINDEITVPLTVEDSPFAGGKSTILATTVGNPEKTKVYHWDGTEPKGSNAFIINSTARQAFSLRVCSGCHAGETQTNFTHVDPVFFGKEATLSGFLTGKAGQGGAFDFDRNANNDSMMVEDPALRPPSDPQVRMFNDILHRAKDLKGVATSACGSVLQIANDLTFQPVNMVD